MLVVGLGNPGKRYAGTPHNVGFRVLDTFAERAVPARPHVEPAAPSSWSPRFDGAVMVTSVDDHELVLLKPLTYMNLSGDSVRLLVNAYLESTHDLMVVYDDIDLPLARLRIRPNGSAGTHNGMRSIISELQSENFPRLRVGIGSAGEGKLRDYVLDEFTPEEQPAIDQAIAKAVDALVLFCLDDLRRAMNQYNKDDVLPSPA